LEPHPNAAKETRNASKNSRRQWNQKPSINDYLELTGTGEVEHSLKIHEDGTEGKTIFTPTYEQVSRHHAQHYEP
jgi:hypothetical protein